MKKAFLFLLVFLCIHVYAIEPDEENNKIGFTQNDKIYEKLVVGDLNKYRDKKYYFGIGLGFESFDGIERDNKIVVGHLGRILNVATNQLSVELEVIKEMEFSNDTANSKTISKTALYFVDTINYYDKHSVRLKFGYMTELDDYLFSGRDYVLGIYYMYDKWVMGYTYSDPIEYFMISYNIPF